MQRSAMFRNLKNGYKTISKRQINVLDCFHVYIVAAILKTRGNVR